MGSHAPPPETITAAVDELTRDRSAMSLEAVVAIPCLPFYLKRPVYCSVKHSL